MSSAEGIRTGAKSSEPTVHPDSRFLGGLRLEPIQLLLLGIALVGAIPRLYLGATQFVEYDGYWHVFIAQQDKWRNFVWDYRVNAHPPLYFLVLKLTLWFGRSLLVYRAISLLTGVAAIYVLGRIASRMMRWPLTPALATLAYGLALPSIIISCEVRQYMLCTFLLLISYYFFLDLIEPEGRDGPLKPRIAFAAATVLACLTHYYAFFYVGAVLILTAVVTILRRSKPLGRALARDAASFAPAVGTMAYLWASHLGAHFGEWGHLLPFYYGGTGPEPLREFLLRNLQNVFNFFSPWPAASRAVFLVLLIGLLAAASIILYLLRRISEPKNLRGIATLLATGLMLTEIMLASVWGKYPFGGNMRHQFLIFPFLVLCFFLFPDRLAVVIPRRVAHAVAAALAIMIVAVSAWRFDAYPKVRRALLTDQMEQYNRLFPAPAAVYVDQFNLVTFFLHHDSWKWKFVERARVVPMVDIYRLSRGDRQTLLFRDKTRWVLDYNDAALYRNLAGCLRSKKLSSITVFRVSQEAGPPHNAAQLAAFRKQVADLSATQGLCVQTLDIEGDAVYAEFRERGCTQAQPVPEQDVDDVSPRIRYTGPWWSGFFSGAMHGTLTYSNQPGATARFSFHGTGIKYVYTKAFNRGKARVSIDGRERAVIDLYDPNILWQTSTVFGGLPPGDHTFEVRVLKSRNPASRDMYVDIDALVLR